MYLVFNHNVNLSEDKTMIIYNKDDNKYLTTEFIQQQTPPP